MSTATVAPGQNPSKLVTRRERRDYLRAFRALGWSQNEAARQIGKDQGLFGRWLRGELASAPMRRLIDDCLAAKGLPRAS